MSDSVPVKFEATVKIEVTEDGVLASSIEVLVNGEKIGLINRMRIDVDSDEVVPSVEIDLLRGLGPYSMTPELQASGRKYFDLLKRVPGLKCVMPAPRKT